MVWIASYSSSRDCAILHGKRKPYHSLTQKKTRRYGRKKPQVASTKQKSRKFTWTLAKSQILFAFLLCKMNKYCLNQTTIIKEQNSISSPIVWFFSPTIELLETVKLTARNWFLNCPWTLKTPPMLLRADEHFTGVSPDVIEKKITANLEPLNAQIATLTQRSN